MRSSDLETVDACNLCGSHETKLDEVYRVKGVDFEMRECVSCGLAFLGARPPEDAMDEWYEDFTHSEYTQSPLHRVATPVLRWFLGRGHHPQRHDGPLTAAMANVQRRTWRRLLSRYHLEWADHPCHCLDVGCGPGIWMAAQRRWGFLCEGVEPDKRAAAKARGLGFQVWIGDLVSAAYPEGSFDIVHFNHVLEHVHDPLAVLAEAARITKPGGRVVVVVPNHNGMHARAFRHVEDVPRHIYSFSQRVVAQYFVRVGLTTERLYSESPDVWALYGPLFHASDIFVRSGDTSAEALRGFWLSPDRRKEFATAAAFADSIGGGVQVVAVGRKPGQGEPPVRQNPATDQCKS